MAKNEFLTKRTAHGIFNFPANTVANSASTTSTGTGIIIPTGAIVTGISYLGGAITGAASAANLTINPSVGGQVLATNDLVATVALVNTVATYQALSVAGGVRVTVGGELVIGFGTTGANRSDVSTGECSIFVDYIYAG